MRSKIHLNHGSQATNYYSWTKEGNPIISSCKDAKMGCFTGCILLQYPFGDHGNADALSCLPLVRNSLGNSTEPSIFNINCIESLPVTSNDIRRETRKDRILSKVLTHTKRGWPVQIPDSLKPFYMRRNELSVEEGCLLWGIQVLIPKSLQEKHLQELHNEHTGISKMKALARSHM